jgi:hypothetical protein
MEEIKETNDLLQHLWIKQNKNKQKFNSQSTLNYERKVLNFEKKTKFLFFLVVIS